MLALLGLAVPSGWLRRFTLTTGTRSDSEAPVAGPRGPRHMGYSTLKVDTHRASRPESVRRTLDAIKAEHGVTETAAYAMLIRSTAAAWSRGPARPVPPNRTNRTNALAVPRVPLQRAPLAG